MLIVILIVCIILIFVLCGLDFEELAVVPSFGMLACLIALIVCTCIVVNGRVIDQKIDMYTAENEVIETQIETVVAEYMKFESETLKDLKGDSVISLVSLYPELKSDELVKAQIETYLTNNDKIKELKEAKINVSNAKWWVYFGK